MTLNEKTEIADRSQFMSGGRTGILLIHGLGGTPIELRYIANGFARAGYTVSCCQLAGHCGTPEELRQSTWQQWMASVEAAHDKLQQQCDVIITGGLSMGALLGTHLAQVRPDAVHGLLLLAPALRLDGWAMPWYSFVLGWARPTPIPLEISLPESEPFGLKDERVRALVVKSMQSGDSGAAGVFATPLRAIANMNALVGRVKKRLYQVTQPALIVHPRHDDMASFKNNAQVLERGLGGPVETMILDNSYHLVTLDQQRHEVLERSLDFVKRAEARAGVAQDRARAQHDRLAASR